MVKVGVSFYYVGDITWATRIYSALLSTEPSYGDKDWVRFHLEGGDIALHLDPAVQPTNGPGPVRYGAVVSLTVDRIDSFLDLASSLGFTIVGRVQDLPYGRQAQLRDPWGNRLSVLQPNEG